MLPLILVALIGLVCLKNHFHGVDWGDDYALYLRQAKALNIGNVGEVLHANRFTVDNSGWHTFSPYSYPWGWPILVAPVYAVFGLNYEAIKALEVVSLCVFLFLFFVLVRRRAGSLAAILLTSLIGMSPSFVGATDTVLSDLPYLGFVGLSLWWMDRCRRRDILNCGRRQTVILGLLLAFTYSIRREGITLLVPLAALHLILLARMAARVRSVRALRDMKWRHLLLPYETFVVAVVALQLLLPTVLRPNAPGAGLHNLKGRLNFYRDILAEHVGIKDAGYALQLFNNTGAAKRAVAALAILAIVGLIARLLYRFEEDITLAAYLIGASFIMLISPYQEGRYLFTITPFVTYFAYQALPTLVRLRRPPIRAVVWLAALVPAVALIGLIVLNAGDTKHSTDYHRSYHLTQNGPELPAAMQMIEQVKSLTRGDDVILFFRARAMTLYTDRLALQGSNLDQMLPRCDWYVMVKGSTYSQALLTDSQASARGLTKAWENSGWVIWRVAPRAR